MRRGLLALLLLALAAASSLEAHFHKTSVRRMRWAVNGHRLNYLLHVPSSVPAPVAGWPLLMFLHGHGECTRKEQLNETRLRVHGPLKKHVHSSPALRSMAIVSPQTFCSDNWFRADVLIAIMEEVRAPGGLARFDPERRYVTGVSSGGDATWALVSNYPHYFAAALPFGAQGDPHRSTWNHWAIPPIPQEFCLNGLNAAGQVAIWISHGARDNIGEAELLAHALLGRGFAQGAPTISDSGPQDGHQWYSRAGDSLALWVLIDGASIPSEGWRTLTTTRPSGQELRFSVYYAGGDAHEGGWSIAYDTEAVYEWMLNQRRPQHLPSLHEATPDLAWAPVTSRGCCCQSDNFSSDTDGPLRLALLCAADDNAGYYHSPPPLVACGWRREHTCVRDTTTGYYSCLWHTVRNGSNVSWANIAPWPEATKGLDISSAVFYYASFAGAGLVAFASFVGALGFNLPCACAPSTCARPLILLSAVISFVIATVYFFAVHGLFNCRGDQENGCDDLHHQWSCVCAKGQRAVQIQSGVGLAAALLSLTLFARLTPAHDGRMLPRRVATSDSTTRLGRQQPLSLRLHIAATTAAHLACTVLSLWFLVLTCERHQGASFWYYVIGENAQVAELIKAAMGLLALYWSAIAPLGQVLHLHAFTVLPLKLGSTADLDNVRLDHRL